LSHSNSGRIFFHISTTLLTPGGLPPVVLFHPGLCGTDCPATSPPGPASAWPASGARSTAPPAWPPNPSPSHNDIFLTFMLIWWDPCSTVIVLIIFLTSLIAHPNGWKLFHFLICPLWHAQKPYNFLGFHVLVCLKQSLPIVGRNLLPTFGLNFARCSISRIDKQQHIILSRTGQSKNCTAASRMRYTHMSP
jgi:hypothetical protein